MKHLLQQPPLRAVPMSMFPSMDTLEEALSYCKAQLPIADSQKVTSLIMLYHNTLINTLKQS